MFKAYLDGSLFYKGESNLEDLQILSPKLELEENSAGTFSFVVPPTNRKYGQFKKLTSRIVIKKHVDSDEFDKYNYYWEGRVIDIKEDFWKCHTITCEGTLAFLNDTIQPSAKYGKRTPAQFLSLLLDVHNTKVEEDKRIMVGTVSIEDTTKIDRYTNFETTFESIRKLVETSGGHVSISYTIRGGELQRRLNWSDTYSGTTTQTIQFGVNLLDYSSTMSVDDFATVLIPQGSKLDVENSDFDTYTDVKSVNDGSIYVSLAASDYDNPPELLPIEVFGHLELLKRWEDITEPSNLLARAKAYLKDQQFDKLQLEIKAFDLRYSSANYESINLLDNVHVISPPHGLDRSFPVKKMSIPLDTPENTAFTLGGNASSSSFTSVVRRDYGDVYIAMDRGKSSITDHYQQEITDRINEYSVGYVNIITDSEHGTQFLVISDNPDYTQATKVWRWGMGGLAFSNDGFESQSYEVAITNDGQINANFINVGVLNADLIQAGILQDHSDPLHPGRYFKFNTATGELFINQLDVVIRDLDNLGGRNFIINTKDKKDPKSGQSRVEVASAKLPRLYEQGANTRCVPTDGVTTAAAHGLRHTLGSTIAAVPNIYFGSTSLSSSSAGLNGLEPGETYVFSGYAAHKLASNYSGSTNLELWVRLRTDSNNPNVAWDAVADCQDMRIRVIDPGVVHTNRFKFVFTVPIDAQHLYFAFFTTSTNTSDFATGDYLELRQLKLEVGKIASSWSAAPEDEVGNDEVITKINASDEGVFIQGDKINLDGNNIVLNGTRGVTISSPHFNVTTTGAVTASSLAITGGSIDIEIANETTDYIFLHSQDYWAKLSPSRLTIFSNLQTTGIATPVMDGTGFHANSTVRNVELVNSPSGGWVKATNNSTGEYAQLTTSGVEISDGSVSNVQTKDSIIVGKATQARIYGTSGLVGVGVFGNNNTITSGSEMSSSGISFYSASGYKDATLSEALTLFDGSISEKTRAILSTNGLQFLGTDGTTTTFNYPSAGLRVSQLNYNVSETFATSGTSKKYTLAIGTYLLTITRYSSANVDNDGVWLVVINGDSSGGVSRSHLVNIVVGTSAPAPVAAHNQLEITTNIAYQRVTITRLS